jgi:hypothetical protein
MGVVDVEHFSDILCVWAYISRVRIDAIKEKFGDVVRIKHRFCSVFGDTATKIDMTWKGKGGYAGFNAHVRQVAGKFPHIEIHPDIWLNTSCTAFRKRGGLIEVEPRVIGSPSPLTSAYGARPIIAGKSMVSRRGCSRRDDD